MANVRDFQYIAEIARYGSITKAAEALYLSQPTLTKFLQRVEQEVGTPLFHRVGKRFIPTPAGEVYVEKAHSILLLNSQLDQELDDLASMRRGSVRVGTTAGRADYQVSTILPRFARRYPGVRVLLSMGHTEQLLKMIFNNELDIVLSNYDGEQPALDHEFIGEEELVLAVPRDSPLAASAPGPGVFPDGGGPAPGSGGNRRDPIRHHSSEGWAGSLHLHLSASGSLGRDCLPLSGPGGCPTAAGGPHHPQRLLPG